MWVTSTQQLRRDKVFFDFMDEVKNPRIYGGKLKLLQCYADILPDLEILFH